MSRLNYSRGATRYDNRIRATQVRPVRRGALSITDPIQKAVAEKMAAFRRRGYLIEECAIRMGLVRD